MLWNIKCKNEEVRTYLCSDILILVFELVSDYLMAFFWHQQQMTGIQDVMERKDQSGNAFVNNSVRYWPIGILER